MRFRGAWVVDEYRRRAGAVNQIAHQPFMGGKIAQHPTATVKEHEYRQLLFDPGRPHQLQQNILALNVDGFLADFHLAQRHLDAALHVLQTLRASLGFICSMGLPPPAFSASRNARMSCWACGWLRSTVFLGMVAPCAQKRRGGQDHSVVAGVQSRNRGQRGSFFASMAGGASASLPRCTMLARRCTRWGQKCDSEQIGGNYFCEPDQKS